MLNKRNVWMGVLILTTLMLIFGIGTTNWIYLIAALVLALIVRIFGYTELVGDYDRARDEKVRQRRQVARALRDAKRR